MKKNIIITLILVCSNIGLSHGQKKRDLLETIDRLEIELDSTKAIISKAHKNEKIAATRTEIVEKELIELRSANEALLNNLKNFTKVSSQNTANVQSALESLRKKELQLKKAGDAIASNDSTSFIVITQTKQSLGENAKVGVGKDGGVILSTSIASLFNDVNGSIVSEAGTEWLGKVAKVLERNPDIAITIEGLSNTGELDIALIRASAVGSTLIKQFNTDATHIATKAKDGGFADGIHIRMHAKYDAFYDLMKESLKN